MSRINKDEVEINMSKEKYKLIYPWPKNVFIQVGTHGVVFSKKGNYSTAFFEAFPLDTFIRGESGKNQTVEDDSSLDKHELLNIAEKNAWKKYQICLKCDEDGGHDYERLNEQGDAKCKNCNIKHSRKLKNIVKCVKCLKSPAYYFYGENEEKKSEYLCQKHYGEFLYNLDYLNGTDFHNDKYYGLFPDFRNSIGQIHETFLSTLFKEYISFKKTLEYDFKNQKIEDINFDLFNKKFKDNYENLKSAERILYNIIKSHLKLKTIDVNSIFDNSKYIDDLIIKNSFFEEFIFDFYDVVKEMKNIQKDKISNNKGSVNIFHKYNDMYKKIISSTN